MINNRILVLGDVHGRLDCIKKIIEGEEWEECVFLGDLVSTHEGISSEDQIETVKYVLDLKKKYKDKVVILRGNHDLQHLHYYWAECSGYNRVVAEWFGSQAMKKRYLKNSQWVWERGGVIFSHAGVSDVWMKNNKIDKIEDINKLEPSPVFAFTPSPKMSWSDMTGVSDTQPPTWIRPMTLVDCAVKGYVQIVGHTPVKHIVNIKDIILDNTIDGEDKEKLRGELYDIWCCDCLPEEYMIIENGSMKVKKIKDLQ